MRRRDEETEEDAKLLTDDVLADQCRFLINASDTTPCAMSWIVYHLCLYADVQTRLQQEIDEICGDEPPTAESINKMRYLTKVINESLRLRPPVANPVPRYVNEDIELSGYKIPAGSQIAYCTYATHRLPEYWNPSPELFNPDRWDNPADNFAFTPFLHGRRNCLGFNLAYLIMKTIITSLFQRYNFHLMPTQVIDEKSAWVIHPTSLHVFVERRKKKNA